MYASPDIDVELSVAGGRVPPAGGTTADGVGHAGNSTACSGPAATATARINTVARTVRAVLPSTVSSRTISFFVMPISLAVVTGISRVLNLGRSWSGRWGRLAGGLHPIGLLPEV
ncbi:hypothetical protein BCF44_13820 [Kutzneria buriramensis]|uniref:Uncharacterized protein n=1 Tax=Kutzneria buriramensis TaxID=1045776 RepID=A0A3E0G5R6_9PSEU|nr:hypothetical protein BCF44_13820 [Kutzneria buriramensis]